MAAHAEKVLQYLAENGPVDSVKLSQIWNEDHQKIVGTVKSLLCLGEVRNYIYLNLYSVTSCQVSAVFSLISV